MSTYPELPIVGQSYTIDAATVAATLNLPTTRPAAPWRFMLGNAGGVNYPSWLADDPAGSTPVVKLTGTPPAAGAFQIAVGKFTAGKSYDVKTITVTVYETPPEREIAFPAHAEPGVRYTLTAAAAATAAGIDTYGAKLTDPNGKWPAWLTPAPGTGRIAGPVAGKPTAADPATSEVGVVIVDRGEVVESGIVTVYLDGGAPVPEMIPAPAARRTADGYTLPDVTGVVWTVNGEDKQPGSYAVQPVTETTVVTITPRALEGYVFETPAQPLVLTFEPAPPPDPEDPEDPKGPPIVDLPDPHPATRPFDPTPVAAAPSADELALWDSLLDADPQALYVAGRIGERILRHVGDTQPSGEALTLAADHAGVVLEYVRGYTRGRGFVGYIPHRALQAVIVAAGARLYVNPEQLSSYQTGDYSERPATLTGWTAAELGVLRRFRRVIA